MNQPGAQFHLKVDSLNFVWFDILGLPSIQFSNFSYVLNCNIKSQIIGNSVESVEWNISAVDPDLKGYIAETPQTVLASYGNWMISDVTKFSGQMEASVKIHSLDISNLLKIISNSLPTTFRNIVETQLRGLIIENLEATYAGDPSEYLNDPDSSKLSVDGEFRNINFENENNLPSIENGSAIFRLKEEKFEVRCLGILIRGTR